MLDQLILSRRVGERITIDNRITIEVVAITSGGRVRLAVMAPCKVPIHQVSEPAEEAAEEECEFVS